MTVWPRKRATFPFLSCEVSESHFCLHEVLSLPLFGYDVSPRCHFQCSLNLFPFISLDFTTRCTLCLTARAIFAVCPANVILSFCVQAPLMIHSASIVSHIAYNGSSYLLLSCCTTAQPQAASRVETPINEQSIAMCSRNPSTLLWHSLAVCPRAMSTPATCCLSILRRTWDTTQVQSSF